MNITFLGQGFLADTDNAVGTIIEKLFSENVYHTFTGITAFASEAGVYGLSNSIADSISLKNINLIVGIDQEGTPKDALEELLKLNINSYIFYQKEAPIFHPKIYLFEGDIKTTIIVGSSNLTGRGLFNNVESSTLIEFDNDDVDGQAYLEAMKDYYATLFDFSDANLFKIEADIIQKFVDLKIVPSKKMWLKKQGKRIIEKSLGDTLEIPSRRVGKLPSSFRTKPKSTEMAEKAMEEINAVTNDKYLAKNLVEFWKSKPLEERDLNIPSGSKTNRTGSMSLSKGLYENIDQRHYFRDDVFGELQWKNSTRRNSEHLEKATANFAIQIDGEFVGNFNLTLNHNPKTDIVSYIQKNSVTSMSWGDAKNLIRKREYLGKTLTLYKDNDSVSQYVIDIQ